MRPSMMTRRKKDQANNDDVLYSPLSIDGNINSSASKTTVKRRRKRRIRESEEPFLITNIKVGTVIAIIGIVLYSIYVLVSLVLSKLRGTDTLDSQNLWSKYVNDNIEGYTGGVAGQFDKNKTFPRFHLNDETINAFNVDIPLMQQNKNEDSESEFKSLKEKDPKKKALIETLQMLQEIKEKFAESYGGENAAREILNRGVVTVRNTNRHPLDGIRHTASRIFQKLNEKKPLRISFTGSSAVAGYGNYFTQTFPSVLADLLTEPFEKLGVDFEVRNAAVADIASFPYGWCLENFMGEEVDIVSWDSSLMNRADTDAAFESYLRRVVTMKSSPLLIIREGAYSESRRKIIQKYVDYGALIDPVIINVNAAAEPFLDLHPDVIPTGFQDWLEFGAPDGSPGKTRSGRTTRLSVKQHDLIAWLISMHLVTAIEVGAVHVLGFENDKEDRDWLNRDAHIQQNNAILPKPLAENVDFNSHLMWGRPIDEKMGVNSTEWKMDEIHCGTTFEPILSGNLEDFAVSGTNLEDLDLMLPRGPLQYNKKWVMDLGTEAKQTAYSFQKYNFDYRFQKKAYYGVKPSGNFTMFLPYKEVDSQKKLKLNPFHKMKKPSDVISSLVLCEVNEYYGEKQCNMVESMMYIVDGIGVNAQYIDSNGASYQGRKNCVFLSVPQDAKWTSRSQMETSKKSLRDKLFQRNDEKGLLLSVSVADELIFWKNGPCSISHVIWEQRFD